MSAPFATKASPDSPLLPAAGVPQHILTHHSRTTSARDAAALQQSSVNTVSTDEASSGSVFRNSGSGGCSKKMSSGFFHLSSANGSKLLQRFKHMWSSRGRHATPVDRNTLHEPYYDSFTDATLEAEAEKRVDNCAEECHYYQYTTADGETHQVDPAVVEYETADQPQVAEAGEVIEAGVGDEGPHQQAEGHNAQHESEAGGWEEQLNGHVRLKGKIAKSFATEEAKARKKLQGDCMIVLTDIGRTYRGLARTAEAEARELKALQHTMRHLEKEAVRCASAVEAEWKKEHAELRYQFRAGAESVKRHSRLTGPSLLK
ncbi:hypothetical protein TraAM80_06566 [Trypanosoma rangeli]|uniref:Uncharacterized protein n=1 Tax=Trypanosoma rangeli TaxID=5698 RepID=A0A3S5IQS8_TRYRA|nr:uncharacterized protein TraAM80_06566 [Trypanosoma rangeli]RNF02141.1 hypothetical protein TraAM80_06566 [Trypanosoma rangeli]|eukprot:RNF02141.1 hypothetical protein TraAM80_06566 [Trypanosoma rangeli]